MNLRPPPKSDDPAMNEWLEELYRFLKYPHFHQIRLVPRATPSESSEGVFYMDTDHYAKIHNGTDFQNLY